MSIRAMVQVLDFAPDHWKATERLVAVIIADHVNDTDSTCFPSVRLIARRAGVSHRQAQRAINQIHADGWIIKDYRFESGRQTSTLYTWTAPVEISLRGVTGVMGEGDT